MFEVAKTVLLLGGVLMLLQEGVWRELPSPELLVSTLPLRHSRTLMYVLSSPALLLYLALSMSPLSVADWLLTAIGAVAACFALYWGHRRVVVLSVWRVVSGRADELKALRDLASAFALAGWLLEVCPLAMAAAGLALWPDPGGILLLAFGVTMTAFIGSAHLRQLPLLRWIASVARMRDEFVLDAVREYVAAGGQLPSNKRIEQNASR